VFAITSTTTTNVFVAVTRLTAVATPYGIFSLFATIMHRVFHLFTASMDEIGDPIASAIDDPSDTTKDTAATTVVVSIVVTIIISIVASHDYLRTVVKKIPPGKSRWY
jgi:diacylglycerol kinase